MTAAVAPEAPVRPAEKPVFAATTATRPRALRFAGRATAVVVGLWLVALALGTLGFGPVAGIGLPRIIRGDGLREAARKAPVTAPAERTSRSGVRLTTRHASYSATRVARRGPTGLSGGSGIRRGSGSGNGASRGTGSSGGATGNGATGTGTRGSSSGQTPASAAPSATVTPTASTTPATSHSNSSNSQATPPGSSSSAPGSRSNAGSAPGRNQSATTPTPGSGRTEHAPPKG